MSSNYLQAISASFGLFSLGAAIAASSIGPAPLTEHSVAKTVSYGDLNLASAEGVQALNKRVRKAAEELCTSRGPKPLTTLWAERACMKEAIAGASGAVELAVTRFERQQYARSRFIEIAARR